MTESISYKLKDEEIPKYWDKADGDFRIYDRSLESYEAVN